MIAYGSFQTGIDTTAVANSTEQMVSSINETAASIEQVTANTTSLASSIAETSTAIEEMASSIINVTDSAQVAAMTDAAHYLIPLQLLELVPGDVCAREILAHRPFQHRMDPPGGALLQSHAFKRDALHRRRDERRGHPDHRHFGCGGEPAGRPGQ